MTLTVEQIEKEVSIVISLTEHSPGWETTIAMLLDYAAMKRKEAESVPARCQVCDGTGDVHSPDGTYRGVCTACASPPSQPSTGVPDLKTLAYDRGTKLALDWIKQAEEASARNERTRAQNLWQCSDELNATLQAAAPRSP